MENYLPKILAFAGSTRTESFNKKTVKVAAEAAKKAGAEVTYIDLHDYQMPLYDGDLEISEGLPENAKKLKKLFLENDGILISCPEYNSSIPGVLKNTIDWISRQENKEEPPLVCFKGKIFCLMSASPGGFGGVRSLMQMKSILSYMGGLVLSENASISKAHDAFNSDGTFKEERNQHNIENLGNTIVSFLKKLNH